MRSPEAKSGFLGKLLSVLTKASDPDKDKKKQLKEIEKQLKRHKFKFYKPKTGEALSAMAKFFYEIYSIVGPAKILLDHAEASVVLKTIIIENYLTEEQLKMKESFEDAEIRKAIENQKGDVKAVTENLKSNLVNFFSIFDNTKVQKINNTFNLMTLFLDFISFDYYFLLRKFDSRFPENDFTYSPRFEDINGEYIVEDLKDFIILIPFLGLDEEWDSLFDVLSEYKGTEIINRKNWQKVLRKNRDVRVSKIMELIIRAVDKDPSYTFTAQKPNKRIVEDYLNKLKSQVELSIQKVLKEKQNRKIEGLAKEVFGTTAISRMKNYTENANIAFSRKMLGGYTYVTPVNYLKAFLIDYCKKDIREISDILLIRGKWTTNISSQQLSDAFYGLMSATEELIAFDEQLSEEGKRGSEISKLLKRRDADKSNITLLRKMLKDINNDALRLMNTSGGHLVAIAKSFKLVYEDYNKKRPELITNWKEIGPQFEGGVAPCLTEAYKKSYYFVQLLQMYTKKK